MSKPLTNEQFEAHLKHASKVVASWHPWKQGLLGGPITPNEKSAWGRKLISIADLEQRKLVERHVCELCKVFNEKRKDVAIGGWRLPDDPYKLTQEDIDKIFGPMIILDDPDPGRELGEIQVEHLDIGPGFIYCPYIPITRDEKFYAEEREEYLRELPHTD